MKTFDELLIELDACKEARDWAKGMTIEQVVANVERGDWLLWLAKKVDIAKRPFTLAKARCAKTVIHLMRDKHSINAINVAEAFGLTDEISEYDLRSAYTAATAAATAAAYAASAYAASAAAYAASAAASAASAASAAAYAASAASAADAAAYAASAAASAADAAARRKNQVQTAEICREILGEMIIKRVSELLTN